MAQNPFFSAFSEQGKQAWQPFAAAAAFRPDAASAYAIDAWQRSVLFADVLRERGNQYQDMMSRPIATVLSFDHEVLLSGQSLSRPINFFLARVLPKAGQAVDPTKRPLVVVDPRAGQGPGIGGFNTISEIGDALEQGHPVYFIGFSADPVPGQTFLDIVEGQVHFLEYIVEQHPDAPKPFAFGNCQAGYQTLLVAALRPDLFGPVIVAGSPMSYWQGVHGKNPMRYTGGLLGGSWLTALVSDLGGGEFDGTWLILNFDLLNPSNWLWGKQYNLYTKIDTEAPRYLGFEKWWGDFIKLNGGEIQWLVDQLFIGDKLTRNQLQASDGTPLDLRNVSSPIVVLTSEGDNISPPQQTLGWILDLYQDVDELRAHGRTIVYSVNPKVGHLAIFVSPKVGGKEDEEFVRLIDEIDLLPPGLYELVIDEADPAEAGKPAWRSHFELRTFDDLRAYGRNSVEDDRAFDAVRRVSELNLSLYNTFVRPWVRAAVTPQLARNLFDYNPLRLSYSVFADSNPFMRGVSKLAEQARNDRQPVAEDNPYLQLQERLSDQITTYLDAWRDARDQAVEKVFFSVYSSPVLQGLLGMNGADGEPHKVPGLTPEEREHLARKAAELEADVGQGGYPEALLRAVLFALSAERVFQDEALVALNAVRREVGNPSAEDFKELVRRQYYILLLKRAAALAPLPEMEPDPARRRELLETVRTIVVGKGTPSAAQKLRLDQLAQLLATEATPAKPARQTGTPKSAS